MRKQTKDMELLDEDQAAKTGLVFTMTDEPKRHKWLEWSILVLSMSIAVYMIFIKIYVIAFLIFFLAMVYLSNILNNSPTEIRLEIEDNRLVMVENERSIHQCSLKQVQIVIHQNSFILKRRYWFINIGMPSIRGLQSSVQPSFEALHQAIQK